MLPGNIRLRLVRMTQEKFTVSAAAVVLNNRKEVLLLNHVLRPYSGWGLPGGFIERGEQPEDAIKREVREETGIELESVRQISVRVHARHVEMVFAAVSNQTPKIKSREIMEVGWYAQDKIPSGLPRSQRAVIESVVKGEI